MNHPSGYVLLQLDPNAENRWKLIKAVSCSITETQQRYATIELEMMAIVFGCNQCKHYITGLQNLEIVTDHRPLLGVLKRDLKDVQNMRLHRFREKINHLNFFVTYMAGKANIVADSLSRAPLEGTFADNEPPSHEDIVRRTTNGSMSIARSDPTFASIFKEAEKDEEYKRVIKAFQDGITEEHLSDINPLAAAMKKIWGEISLIDGEKHPLMLVNGTRVVLPKSEIARIIDLVHLGHMGVQTTLETAKASFWWPHMTMDIQNKLKSCEACQLTAKSRQHEPALQEHIDLADLQPWDHINLDFCELGGKYYLICADKLTGFAMHKMTKGLSCEDAMKALEEWIYVLGIPKFVRTDGGPAFSGEAFNKFCESRNIVHEQSSVGHASSNGCSESAVGRIKRAIRRATISGEDVQTAVAEMRNSIPPNLKVSAADLFHKRQVRGFVPRLNANPDFVDVIARKDIILQERINKAEGRKQPSTPLKVNDVVRVQNRISKEWEPSAKVISVRENGVSYWLVRDGRLILRNRDQLSDPITNEHENESNIPEIKNPISCSGIPPNLPDSRKSGVNPRNDSCEQDGECTSNGLPAAGPSSRTRSKSTRWDSSPNGI